MIKFKKLRKDEYILDESVIRLTKEKDMLIKELDYRHFRGGRFA